MTMIQLRTRPLMSSFFVPYLEQEFQGYPTQNAGFFPQTNIQKTDEHFEIEMALAGISREDVKISLENHTLSIHFEARKDQENQTYIRREYKPESFTKHYTMPKTVSIDQISASYRDGMLIISIPYENPEKNKVSREIRIG